MLTKLRRRLRLFLSKSQREQQEEEQTEKMRKNSASKKYMRIHIDKKNTRKQGKKIGEAERETHAQLYRIDRRRKVTTGPRFHQLGSARSKMTTPRLAAIFFSFLCCSASSSRPLNLTSNSSSGFITRLPGFQGPLPFHLQTGY